MPVSRSSASRTREPLVGHPAEQVALAHLALRRRQPDLEVLHDPVVVRVRPVELEQRELGVVGLRDLPVPIHLADLEDRAAPVREQALHRVFRAGVQVEVPPPPHPGLRHERDLEGHDVRLHAGRRHQRRRLHLLEATASEAATERRVHRLSSPRGGPLSGIGHEGAGSYIANPMSPRTGFVVAVVISLVACHRTVPGAKPEAFSTPEQRLVREIDELASRAERLVRIQDEVIWKHWTEGAPLDLSASLSEQGALYTRENLARIDALRRRTADANQARALELLRAHFAGEYVAQATSAPREEFEALQTTLTFEVDGQVHSLRDLERLLARERNALTRQSLQQAATEAIRKLAPAADGLQAAVGVARTEASYGSRLELAANLRRIHPERLAATAERLLRETDAEFRKVLEQLAARELRLPFENVRMRDLPRMFRSRDVDELFPAKEIPARAAGTVRGLGIESRAAGEGRRPGSPPEERAAAGAGGERSR